MKAGILGGVFFLAQIVVPIIVMMAAGSVMVFSEILNFERAYARQAASWEGRVYYPASTQGFRRTKPETHLKVLGLEEKARPVIAAPLGSKDCCLLQGTDRLWVIAADAVGSYRDGEVTWEDPGERLGGITRPFLYRGLPAVVEERPNGRVLRTFADGRWQTGVPFDLHLQVQGGTAPEPDPGSLQVVADGGTLHLFLDYHGTLYHREGLPRPDGDAAGAWQPVDSVGKSWVAVATDTGPAVFLIDTAGFHADVRGIRKSLLGWESFFSHSLESIAIEVGVCPLRGEGNFVLLLSGLPGSLQAVEIRNGQVARSTSHGGMFPFSSGMMGMMFVPHLITLALPLLLAVVLAPMMQKHRVTRIVAPGTDAEYASLPRRAIAQAVDMGILAGPAAGVFLTIFPSFADGMMNPLKLLTHFGLLGLASLWGLAGIFVFSAMEGRSGKSPGKWLTGIRVVGTDLRPCGFGRALIRNFLRFVDGIFNFLVGLLLIALTENWQRLGDLAARTVVVRSPAPHDNRAGIDRD